MSLNSIKQAIRKQPYSPRLAEALEHICNKAYAADQNGGRLMEVSLNHHGGYDELVVRIEIPPTPNATPETSV